MAEMNPGHGEVGGGGGRLYLGWHLGSAVQSRAARKAGAAGTAEGEFVHLRR